MSYLEGTIEIPMEEFWAFVAKHVPVIATMEIAYGVPRVTKDRGTMEIDFAASSDEDPAQWIKKPISVLQWEELKNDT